MARYVDGFVLALPRKNVAAYQRLSRKASAVWREHGALEYRECVGDDLKVKGGVAFPRLARCRPGETVVFAWDQLQVPRAPRPCQREGHEGPADRRNDEPKGDAVRRQAHGLRRLPGLRLRLTPRIFSGRCRFRRPSIVVPVEGEKKAGRRG